MANVNHKDLTGTELHVAGYVQTSDPGAVGAGILWVDTSGGTAAWKLKVRNATNLGWELIVDFTKPYGAIGSVTAVAVTATSLSVTGAAASSRAMNLQTAAANRWIVEADNVAEGGSNAGSNFVISAYSDAAALVGKALEIKRSTRQVIVYQELNVVGDFNHDGTNLGVFGQVPAARGALAVPTGTIQRTTYATGTVTLAQLAGVVMALITDFRLMGFFS